MRFVVLGASELTILCATALQDADSEVSALVSMPSNIRPNNPADIAGFADRFKVPYHEVADINSPESVSLVRGYSPDYVFCTWPKMLKREALKTARNYCIGTHSTELPFNRGRHCLHWLIALGIPDTMMSFFRMDEGVDTGDLLLQEPFEIGPDDSIRDVNSKMNEAAYRGVLKLSKILLADPLFLGVKQDHAAANYWRKRTPHDVTLDLRMSSSMVLGTVRSYLPPYPCANLIFEDQVIKISGASVAEGSNQMDAEKLRRIEPGRIICIDGNRIRVKVDDAIVDLECSSPIPSRMLKAKYIHPPTKYLARWPNLLASIG